MPPNHASPQRFSFTILPNASRLDFSSTLLTFYNTTRPLTLLGNIPTCENAKEAGFLVRSPQGSNIQHVSICKKSPQILQFDLSWQTLYISNQDRSTQDFQFNKPHHGDLEVHYDPSTLPSKSFEISTPGLPQMWSLICSSETSSGLLGIAEAPAPMALELEMCSMVTPSDPWAQITEADFLGQTLQILQTSTETISLSNKNYR